jgi:hypothetical protein
LGRSSSRTCNHGTPAARRAQPDGLLGKAISHRFSDRTPERQPLPLRGEPHERRQVSVRRRIRKKSRHHENRIAAEIGERDDVAFRSAELLGEGGGICGTCKIRIVEQHALERPRCRIHRGGERLPSKRRKRTIGKQGVEEGTKGFIFLECLQHLCNGSLPRADFDDESSARFDGKILASCSPHRGNPSFYVSATDVVSASPNLEATTALLAAVHSPVRTSDAFAGTRVAGL